MNSRTLYCKNCPDEPMELIDQKGSGREDGGWINVWHCWSCGQDEEVLRYI